jgi:hypothetical protein
MAVRCFCDLPSSCPARFQYYCPFKHTSTTLYIWRAEIHMYCKFEVCWSQSELAGHLCDGQNGRIILITTLKLKSITGLCPEPG